MTTLARRLVAMALLVASVSVLVTGAALLGLFRQGAAEAARVAFARDAETVAATIEDQRARRGARGERLGLAAQRRQLARRDITLALVEDGPVVELPAPLLPDDAAAVRMSGSLSDRRREGGTDWLVEGRVAGSAAILVAQPLDQAVADTAPPRRRLLLPLVVGLLAGAGAGLLLARELARPLAAVAAAARRLSAGHRDITVPTEGRAQGPAEVAEVARALDELASALATSEERQRRFLLDVSHELRTPLTAVSGYAEALEDGVLHGDEVPRAAAVIRAEAARLQHRVQDLLALARMEADDFRLDVAPTDVAALLRSAALAWQPQADGAGVRLTVESPERPLVVVTDAERVRQAVDALVDNAIRVLPSGAPLVLAARIEDGLACVEVRDGGPGLSAEDMPYAFDRGRLSERYRGDRPVGSGLGLALVGALAHRLGGHARARPAPEGGVAFAVLLPLPLTDGSTAVENPNMARTQGEPPSHSSTGV